jgi:hypothetical protein
VSGPPASARIARFGTFSGVFVPTLLTILGVIMYLRLGWVVGNAGLVGGTAVILLACGITLTTGLSLASISTNTRLEAGGPYAIISRSLGQEVGGAVGLPLYLSQALAVAMYIFGFREGWGAIFPSHPPLLVDFGVFAVVFGVAIVSTSLAFRIQYVVLAVIASSLVATLANPVGWTGLEHAQLFGDYSGTDAGTPSAGFWMVFAVFFPAATGIMAGANMSGHRAAAGHRARVCARDGHPEPIGLPADRRLGQGERRRLRSHLDLRPPAVAPQAHLDQGLHRAVRHLGDPDPHEAVPEHRTDHVRGGQEQSPLRSDRYEHHGPGRASAHQRVAEHHGQ